jgi:hypothetical protein
MAEGVAERHARSCRSRNDGGLRCNCSPSYQVNLWDGRSQRRIRKTSDAHGGEDVAAGRRRGAQSRHSAGFRRADGQAGGREVA